MPFFSSHVIRADGNTEKYVGTFPTAEAAGQDALDKYDKWITKKLSTMKTGTSEFRTWERLRVPRVVEVNDTNGRVVDKFGAKKA